MFTFKKQQGVSLVVSLFIMLVLTIIGITGMDKTTSQLKFVSSFKDRNMAFEAAEVALSTIEADLIANTPHASLINPNCTSTTSGCFNNTCTGGRCFSGEFDPILGVQRCEIDKDSEFWKDDTVWSDTNKHQTLSINSIKNDVRYIIEFLCFTPVNDDILEVTNEGIESGTVDIDQKAFAQLYRISAQAEGNGGRANVFLQSYYRVVQK